MKETNHDYQGCLMGNYYDNKCTGEYKSWEDFKNTHLGFYYEGNSYKILCFDDRYHFVFRYDIHKQKDGLYTLELCMVLQRKGIYTHLWIYNIDHNLLNGEVKTWLECRYEYMNRLWQEVSYSGLSKLVNNIG